MQTFDVVSVPFPYVERPVTKRRPAVVISGDTLARDNGLLWVSMITSSENAGWPGDIEISDTGTAGLKHSSVIRPAKLATVEAASVKTIGKLEPTVAKELQKQIAAYLGAS